MNDCKAIEEFGLKMLGFNYELFKELVSTAGTGSHSDDRCTFLNKNVRVLELCSNKFGNKGLNMLKSHLKAHCENESKIEYLSLQDCEL